MPTLTIISIEVPSNVLADVQAAVRAGEYESPSDVVTAALRSWSLTRAVGNDGPSIQAAVREALDDASDIDADEVLDRLEAEYRARAEAARTSECA